MENRVWGYAQGHISRSPEDKIGQDTSQALVSRASVGY